MFGRKGICHLAHCHPDIQAIQGWTLKHREVKWAAQDHTASKWQPAFSTLRIYYFTEESALFLCMTVKLMTLFFSFEHQTWKKQISRDTYLLLMCISAPSFETLKVKASNEPVYPCRMLGKEAKKWGFYVTKLKPISACLTILFRLSIYLSSLNGFININ